MSWFKALLRWGSRAKLVGADLTGNQYFEKTLARGKVECRYVVAW